MKANALLIGLSVALCAAATPPTPVQAAEHELDRTKLPIAEPDYPHSKVLDARNAKPPPRFDVKALVGAPHVVIVLIDDIGFGHSSAFGGPIRMPTLDKLANGGLKYTEVELKDDQTQGVIIAQAGYFGGWVLYLKEGKLHHEYNWFGIERTNIKSDAALASGKHTVRYEFIPDKAKPDTGGKSILSVDGKKVAEGQIPRTQPFAFSADENADVGMDSETNESSDYKPGIPSTFTGKIVKVTVEQK